MKNGLLAPRTQLEDACQDTLLLPDPNSQASLLHPVLQTVREALGAEVSLELSTVPREGSSASTIVMFNKGFSWDSSFHQPIARLCALTHPCPHHTVYPTYTHLALLAAWSLQFGILRTGSCLCPSFFVSLYPVQPCPQLKPHPWV